MPSSLRTRLNLSRLRLPFHFGFLVISLGILAWSLFDIYTCNLSSNSAICEFHLYDTLPVLIAIGFWFCGAILFWQKQSFLEAAFFLLGSASLSAGLAAGINDPVGIPLFAIFVALYAPITLHFFLAQTQTPRSWIEKISLILFYSLAVLLSIVFLVTYLSSIGNFELFKKESAIIKIFYSVSIVWTLLLTSWKYQRFSSLASRRRLRLFTIGGLFAFAPLILLTVLPQSLGMNFVQSAINMPWLLLVPLFFLYATFRSRLSFAEKTFSTILVYYLLVMAYVSLFLIASGIETLFPISGLKSSAGIAAVLITILSFLPLRRRITTWIKKAFYGSETDYAIALNYLANQLATTLERSDLVRLLINELAAALKPAHLVLYLKSGDAFLAYAGESDLNPEKFPSPGIRLAVDSHTVTALLEAGMPTPTDRLIKLVADGDSNPHNPDELLLHTPHIALWIPLIANQAIQGLILLSLRPGDDFYTEEDRALLSHLVPNGGAAIRNVLLAEEMVKSREELLQAQRNLITVQEFERQRIAMDLHDDTIQQLLGVSFQVADIKKKYAKNETAPSPGLEKRLDEVRNNLSGAIVQIRALIKDLRPAGFEEMGMRAVLEEIIDQNRRINPQGCPELELRIGAEISELPDLYSICIYRIVQEAVRNAIKHASATRVQVSLGMEAQEIVLKIQDNGKGFILPGLLGDLIEQRHFGLVNIIERTKSVGGNAEIIPVSGEGTTIKAHFPMRRKENGQSIQS